MTSPAEINNARGSKLVRQDGRMLFEEEGLNIQKTESEEDDDQIKDKPMLSDQNFSRNSYVYADEDRENDQYFQTGIYKRWPIKVYSTFLIC